MSRIASTFAALRARNEKALVAYIAAGDPSLEATPALVKGMEAAGVDMIELGLAFSDPLADGPTIQAGSQRALAAGANTDKVLTMIGQIRADGVKLPILIMTYYNLLLRPGLDSFCARAKAAGVDGLIIPDLPLEESGELREACGVHGLDLIQFVAPTSPPERIRASARAAAGFVYCVSMTGVTGTAPALLDRFAGTVRQAQAATQTPVAVGFGIATAQQVRQVAAIADAVIVGSAIVKLCGEGLPLPVLVERVSSFVAELKAGTKQTAEKC